MTTRELNRMTIDQAAAAVSRAGFTLGRPTTTKTPGARGGWATTYPVTDTHGVTVTMTTEQLKQLVRASTK